MSILSFLRELWAFKKGLDSLKAKRFAEAVARLSTISMTSPNYGFVQGMIAFCQVNLGLFSDAQGTLRRLRDAEKDDPALLAYADVVDAVMVNDLGRYGGALQRYNAEPTSRFVRRNLPLFYPKPHGGLH